jgi:hypothetical protein
MQVQVEHHLLLLQVDLFLVLVAVVLLKTLQLALGGMVAEAEALHQLALRPMEQTLPFHQQVMVGGWAQLVLVWLTL